MQTAVTAPQRPAFPHARRRRVVYSKTGLVGPLHGDSMRLSAFIERHADQIVIEWASFARTMLPSAKTMTDLALRDHGLAILLAISAEMDTRQSEAQRSTKSKGADGVADETTTAAATHGALRQSAGFDLVQLVAEFRAMRASVLALWRKAQGGDTAGPEAIEEITRFNEGIDQALAESVNSYSAGVEASRDMFLAVLGHDLRGPLSVIRMSNAVIARPGLSEEARLSAALRIERATKWMGGLITDLLEFTRTRLGGGIPINMATCDLGAVCVEAVDAVRTSYPASEFVLSTEGEVVVRGDVPRLQQVLSNLLNNAVQHGARGQPIVVRVRADGEHAVLTVQNSGRPIPPEALQVIFEPLVQAQDAVAEPDERSKTSIGLGLFIVREIVRGHGGEVAVESSAATGTVFTVRLPRNVAAAGAAA